MDGFRGLTEIASRLGIARVEPKFGSQYEFINRMSIIRHASNAHFDPDTSLRTKLNQLRFSGLANAICD